MILVTHKGKVLAERHNEVLDILNDALLDNSLVGIFRVFYVDEVKQIFILKRLQCFLFEVIIRNSLLKVVSIVCTLVFLAFSKST